MPRNGLPEGIAQLELDAQAAKQAVTESVSEAKDKTNALVVHTEEQLQAYGKQVGESEEAVLLKKRYAELEAQAALLKAQLAASADATREQAQSYLDEAKALWPTHSRWTKWWQKFSSAKRARQYTPLRTRHGNPAGGTVLPLSVMS